MNAVPQSGSCRAEGGAEGGGRCRLQVAALKQQLRQAEAAAPSRSRPAGSFPPPPRFNAKPHNSFASPRGAMPGWDGPAGGRPRHDSSALGSGERKRPHERDVRDDRSHSNKRSSR